MILFLLAFSVFAEAKIKVATTTTDLAALVNAVGGANVEVFSLAKGSQDPHQIEAKPSFMVKLADVDLIVSQGLDLESAWLTSLIEGSRNAKIRSGTQGFLELGSQLAPIEVNKTATRAEGDVHPDGNPHFQLDPVRMGQGAKIIGERLSAMDPAHKEEYTKSAADYASRMDMKTKEWNQRIKRSGIKELVTFHRTFSYFLDRFGIQGKVQLEPKPGIPPTAAHIMDVIAQIKARGIKLVLIENYFDDSVRTKLQTDVPGLKVKVVPVAVDGTASVKTTEEVVESLVRTIEEAAK